MIEKSLQIILEEANENIKEKTLYYNGKSLSSFLIKKINY